MNKEKADLIEFNLTDREIGKEDLLIVDNKTIDVENGAAERKN